jgi:hypothetical protein
MSNTLNSAIAALATTFANSVVAAIRGASLEDILTVGHAGAGAGAPSSPRRTRGRPAKRATEKPAATTAARSPIARAKPSAKAAPAPKSKPGRLARRSADDIGKALARVVELVKKNPKGLRAEQIRSTLKMQSKEMPRVLKEGLVKKTLKSKGQKRATTYSAA